MSSQNYHKEGMSYYEIGIVRSSKLKGLTKLLNITNTISYQNIATALKEEGYETRIYDDNIGPNGCRNLKLILECRPELLVDQVRAIGLGRYILKKLSDSESRELREYVPSDE